MKRPALSLLVVSLVALGRAETPAQRTFAALKKLQGTWGMGSGDKTAKVVYKVTGGGSTLMETQFPGSTMEMITLYHLDGPDKLVLTHYCAAGNQPSMALVTGGTATDFRFDFTYGSNMKPTDMHIHNVHYRLVAPDHIVTEWGGYINGKPSGPPEAFDLHRIQS